MANTEDLRYKRTETAIRAAFIELASETPVSKVSVTSICRRASISRNAFYLHYASVPTLYEKLVEELLSDVLSECVASSKRVTASGEVDKDLAPAILNALSRHEDLLRALLPADNGSLCLCLADGLSSAYVEAALLFGEHGGSEEHRLACSFAAWAHVGLVRRWITSTSAPLSDLLPTFKGLQAGISSDSTKFLMESRDVGR